MSYCMLQPHVKQIPKFLPTLLLIISINFTAFSQKEGIQFFNGSLSEALDLAKEKGKSVFVDGYTTWCAPCKWMDKKVFVDESVGAFFNAQFVPFKLDMESSLGKEFAKLYNVTAYPTYLFFEAGGDLVHKIVGSRQAEEFIAEGRNALDPNKSYTSLKKGYESGRREPELLYAYSYTLKSAGESEVDVLKTYFMTQREEDLSKKENIDIIFDLSTDMSSREFKYLLQNKEQFISVYSKDQINHKINRALFSQVLSAAKAQDEPKFAQLKKTLQQIFPDKADSVNASLALTYYSRTKQWDHYTEAASTYVNTFAYNNSDILNNVAWDYYLLINDEAQLQNAETWVLRSIDITESTYNVDTYARLLHKLGNMKEAKKQCKRAIALAKKSGEDFSDTQKFLNQIEMAQWLEE